MNIVRAAVLAGAPLTATVALPSVSEAATYIYAVTKDGECYKTETSVYTGENQYQVNGKVRSFSVPDVSRYVSQADIAELKAARAKRQRTPRVITDAVTTHVAPKIKSGFRSAVLDPILALPNVIAAKMTAVGNPGKTSVYEKLDIATTVGASVDFKRCRNVRSSNRPDGNQYGKKGFGKDLDNFVLRLIR